MYNTFPTQISLNNYSTYKDSFNELETKLDYITILFLFILYPL